MAWRIENPIETVVGAAVIAAASLFAYYASQAGGGTISDGYRLKAAFSSATGVSVGTDVRVAGVKVGRVSGLELDKDTYFANTELTLKSGVELPIDSLAKVASENLLGGAFIALEPGADDVMLADGDVIELTQGAADLLDLIQQFGGSSGGGGSDNSEESEQSSLDTAPVEAATQPETTVEAVVDAALDAGDQLSPSEQEVLADVELLTKAVAETEPGAAADDAAAGQEGAISVRGD